MSKLQPSPDLPEGMKVQFAFREGASVYAKGYEPRRARPETTKEQGVISKAG